MIVPVGRALGIAGSRLSRVCPSRQATKDAGAAGMPQPCQDGLARRLFAQEGLVERRVLVTNGAVGVEVGDFAYDRSLRTAKLPVMGVHLV